MRVPKGIFLGATFDAHFPREIIKGGDRHEPQALGEDTDAQRAGVATRLLMGGEPSLIHHMLWDWRHERNGRRRQLCRRGGRRHC